MLVIKPLNELVIESVYKTATSWSPFGTREKVLRFLEDRITGLITCVHHDISNQTDSAKNLSELIARQTFYTVVLLRYMQKTTGLPKHVQHLPIYNTPEGNQIDMYIEEFFKHTS